MSLINSDDARSFLAKSIASLNNNKLIGIQAEAEFRSYLQTIGGSARVSPGGWIFRQKGAVDFGKSTIAVFPHRIMPGVDYSKIPEKDAVPLTLHTICATMHQIGIKSYYAYPVLEDGNDVRDTAWKFIQLGVPWTTDFMDLADVFADFLPRVRPYNYLRYNTNVSSLPDADALIQLSHESLRVFVESSYLSETSDIDGIVWGQRYTYPIEIKEKVAAVDKDMGEWFGLDAGPFVKLAHYAARRGSLHSLFIVREMANTPERPFRQWLFTEFDQLAQRASWVPRSGGASMGGGRSMVVRIPRHAFRVLDAASLADL